MTTGALSPTPPWRHAWHRLRAGMTWLRVRTDEPVRDRWRNAILIAIVVVPMCFNAYALWPEVSERVPGVNDDTFHHLMIESASRAIERGENPLDSWGPEMDLGAPRFIYYQNLPALFVIALDRLTLGQVEMTSFITMVMGGLRSFSTGRRGVRGRASTSPREVDTRPAAFRAD